MASDSGSKTRRRVSRWLLPLVGYCFSIACLVWVYSGFDWKAELPRLMAADWWWVTLAVVSDVLVYVIQGWRWNLLLRPLARLPLWRTVQTVYIGLFANEVLPLRTGELIRCYLLGRWNALPFPVVVSSAAIERLLDGIWLALGFYAVTHFVELPGFLIGPSKFLVLVLLVFATLLAIAILRRSHAREAVSRSRWGKLLHGVVDGLHTMGHSSSFFFAVMASFLFLALQVIPIYALFRGYGMDLSIGAAMVVLVVLRLGTLLPQAPGNVGSFQFFTVLGLRLFQVPEAEATGYATLLFVVVTVPLWAGGFLALLATRMHLRQLRRDAQEALSNGDAS